MRYGHLPPIWGLHLPSCSSLLIGRMTEAIPCEATWGDWNLQEIRMTAELYLQMPPVTRT